MTEKAERIDAALRAVKRARFNAAHAETALQSAAVHYVDALRALGGIDDVHAPTRRALYREATHKLYEAAKKCTNARHEVGRAEKKLREA